MRAGNAPVLQLPLTYRNERLDGADAWLLGTMQHSVLGERWTYDATGDPVYLLTLATAALTGGRQADQFIEIEGVLTEREPTAVVSGSGKAGATVPALPSMGCIQSRNEDAVTIIDCGELHVEVARVLTGSGPLAVPAGAAAVTGTWTDHPDRTVLATIRLA